MYAVDYGFSFAPLTSGENEKQGPTEIERSAQQNGRQRPLDDQRNDKDRWEHTDTKDRWGHTDVKKPLGTHTRQGRWEHTDAKDRWRLGGEKGASRATLAL